MWPYSACGVFTAATVSNAFTFLSRRLVTTAGAAPRVATDASVPSAA